MDSLPPIKNLKEFTESVYSDILNKKFIPYRHYLKIVDVLQDVITNPRNVIINVSPRSGKTDVLIKMFLPFCLGWYPDSEFIITSYSQRVTNRYSNEARNIVNSPAYRKWFPLTRLTKDSKAKNLWSTTAGGVVLATSTLGTVTGFGAGKQRDGFGGAILLDDPSKAQDKDSLTITENVIEWYQGTLSTRRNTPDTPVIVIAQRLSLRDLPEFLLSGGSGEDFEKVIIPALQDGKSFCDLIYPVKTLIREKEHNNYNFQAQYQQDPVIKGGAIFKNEDFIFYKKEELNKVFKEVIMTSDTAMKTGERNDYSVAMCFGIDEENKIYLIDMFRGKFDAPTLFKYMTDFYTTCIKKFRVVDVGYKYSKSTIDNNQNFIVFHIEDKASGTGLIQSLQRETYIPVRPIKTNKDKVERAHDISKYVKDGWVYIPEDAYFTKDLLKELLEFSPETLSIYHDDQVDAFGYGVGILVERYNKPFLVR